MYATEVEDRTFVFGSSGLLFRSNKLMYDRRSNSLWHALTGEPVVGILAHSGITLRRLPLVVTTWGQWRDDHPDTKVLSLDTGYTRDYTPGRPYGAYFASAETMFPVWQRSRTLPTKALVYALTVDGVPKAYPLTLLEQEHVTNDRLGSVSVVLVTDGRGRTVRAYRGEGHRFARGPDDRTLLDELGSRWTVTEDALVSGSAALPRVAGHVAYWFGWFAFNPRTLVYGQ